MSNPTITASASTTTMVAVAAAPPTIAAGSSAQAQAAAFADDSRVHFDRQAGTWRLEDDDGNEMEYDAAKGAWVPVVSTPVPAMRDLLFETEELLPLFLAFRGSAEGTASSLLCSWR